MNLKLNTLAFALSCATAFTATAQQSIGIQAGAGIGRVRSGYFHNDGAPRIRMNLGVSYQRFISRHVTIGADLLYQQRGWRTQSVILDVNFQPIGTAQVPYSYNYAALPIKIGYRSANEKASFGYARIGVVPGVLLSASRKEPAIDGTNHIMMNDVSRRVDIAGLAELGGGWHLAEQLRLEAGLAFQYSFTSVSEYVSGRHLGLALNFGLRYELGAKKPGAGKAEQAQ